MRQKDGKSGIKLDKKVGVIFMNLMFVTLCSLSFYLGGIFCSQKNKIEDTDIVKGVKSFQQSVVVPLQIKAVAFNECSSSLTDYTPCTDPKRWRKFGRHRLTHFERHCPPPSEKKVCLVPPPDGYKPPIRWPKSRNECWYRNVPYEWINKQKSDQHWLKKEGDKFLFPGGGTMFPDGVGVYNNLMQDLIPEMRDGSVRTAIDTGCGVASWGGDLLDRGILTMSLAPRDNHQAQVQFALERGIPAILGIISTQRLPFPSNSFDLAHCSRCLIPWTEFGGLYLLEINRILRPGGFWVLSGPPVNYKHRWQGWNTTIEELRSDYEKLQDLLSSMCFELYKQKDDIAVWRKASDSGCYDRKLSKSDVYPPKCDDSMEPDAAWYTPLRPCLVVPDLRYTKIALGSIPKWPERFHVTPERISVVHKGKANTFKKDDVKWKIRVKHYKKLLPVLGTEEIRNVMDMNAIYGGFASALIEDPVWVMNVVSSYGANSLPIVYDRGLIGVYHDWCEAFSTYPRTYDLLHLDGLFTAESHRCDMKYILFEMDRILRPNAYTIIRESYYFVDAITTIAKGMRWNCRREDTEYGGDKEKVLICKKSLWYSSKN